MGMRWTERLEGLWKCAVPSVVVLAGTAASPAQTSLPSSNLALILTPESTEGRSSHGPPLLVSVSLTNITTHIIRLPNPALNCSAIPLGTLSLNFDFKPLRAASTEETGQGCFDDFAHSTHSILEQIASWNLLLPGQSLVYTSKLDKAIDSPPKPGSYTLSARYKPPFVFPDERDALERRGIDIPSTKLSSEALVYRVSSRQAHR